jgi:dihydroflavonol-4-reductase
VGEHPARVEVAQADVTSCVTGATGFIGGHVARLQSESGQAPRVTYRDERRLERLEGLDVEPCRADALDRSALRRAFRGCDLVFHTVGYVASRPAERVWELNALAPRITVEAAAAEGVRRVVLTSSVAGIGPSAPDEVNTEDSPYRGGGLGLTYVDAKHEGENEALAAAARLGVEVVIVNPSYVFGVPVDTEQPGETSTRMVGNYMSGRLPAVVDSHTNVVDVRDVAEGHIAAAERGRAGERYILGGDDITWVELLERVGELAGVHHPLLVLPRESADAARVARSLGLSFPISPEGVVLMAQDWRVSSRKARRELGYKPRPLADTLRETVGWYRDLQERGALDGGLSAMSLAAAGVRLAGRAGALGGLRVAGSYLGRRLVAGR